MESNTLIDSYISLNMENKLPQSVSQCSLEDTKTLPELIRYK
jgi:hypothetical protein